MATAPTTTDCAGHNEVRLVGRLSGLVEIKTLPSGDKVATWRLVVPRPDAARMVDTIDCEGYSKRLIGLAERWPAGINLEIAGALRRRFWQSPAGARSRYTVDVHTARRVKPPQGSP